MDHYARAYPIFSKIRGWRWLQGMLASLREFSKSEGEVINDKPLFTQRLADYLIFYNALRPHKSLDLKSPLEYLVEKG